MLLQVATTHPENPAREGTKTPDGENSSTLIEDINATFRTIAWQRLRVLGTECGASADEGKVQFEAYFKVVNQKGQRQKGNVMECLHETSTFRRHDGSWKYVSGDTSVTVIR